jgi:hypothetical protein
MDDLELIEISTRDNIILRGVCCFKKINNIKQKCITILSFSPYRNSERKDKILLLGNFLLQSSIPAHYIYIDIRGTGESEGVAINEYSQDEILDSQDVIKFIRKQIWSNGFIMMHGISYSAFNAVQSCSNEIKPDALFIMHVSNDRYYNDIHYFGGVKTITEDLNYSFAMTGENLLNCERCIIKNRINSKNLDIIPWYMKWFNQQCMNNIEWKNGLIDSLPPTFLICGWRDSYASSAVILSKFTTFTLIGPFGHNRPENHNNILEWWLNYITNNLNKKTKPYLIVIPTPRSLWDDGYYNISTYDEEKTIFKKSYESDINKEIILQPDLVGDSLEVYISGDPYEPSSIDVVRNDLCRNNWGFETIINNNDTNIGIWGIPYILFETNKYLKGDYIVARLITEFGETLTVGVKRIEKGINKIELRPFFIPQFTKIHLFLNRSWVPVLFPTMNSENIIIKNIKVYLPIINKKNYIKLFKLPHKSEIALLLDVKPKKIIEKNKLQYYVVNDNDPKFKEYLFAKFELGILTKVTVEDYYPNIKTVTKIISSTTDEFQITIKAYSNDNTLINEWSDLYKRDCE